MEWRVGMYTAIISGVLLALGYLTYIFSIATGQTELNATTWGLWAISSLVVLLLYEDLTKDTVKAIPLMVDASVIGIIFAFAVLTGVFTAVDPHDYVIIAVELGILGFWALCRKKHLRLANILLQIDLVVTFLPTIEDVLKDPTVEAPLSWGLWTAAYFFMFLTSLFRWKDLESTFTPVNYFLLHAIVFAITFTPFLGFLGFK